MKPPQAGIRSTRKKAKTRQSNKLGLEISESETENEENPTSVPAPSITPDNDPQEKNTSPFWFVASPWSDTTTSSLLSILPK